MLMKACMDVTVNRLATREPPPPLTGSILGLLIGQWLGLFFPPEWERCARSRYFNPPTGDQIVHTKTRILIPLLGNLPLHTQCVFNRGCGDFFFRYALTIYLTC